MKSKNLTKQQMEELEKFGANTWFVEYLYDQFSNNPEKVPEQWRKFFGDISTNESGNGKNKLNLYTSVSSNLSLPQPGENDDVHVIAGSSEKILNNMVNSLSVPVATSQRTVPVKLLEENRTLINNYLKKVKKGKISFTHLISWAILKAIKSFSVMNNAFTVIDGKPNVIKRKDVNLGLAIDIEYYYDGIVDLAIKFGSIDENPSDKLYNKVCENYWLFMANVICGMEQNK